MYCGVVIRDQCDYLRCVQVLSHSFCQYSATF